MSLRWLAVAAAGPAAMLIVCPAWAQAQALPEKNNEPNVSMTGAGLTQGRPAAEDYAASIRGIRVGMTLGDVLERLEPLPYSGKQDKAELVLVWTLENGDALEVTLRGERVVQLYQWYRTPRSAATLRLPSAVKPGEGVVSNDPRIRREFEIYGTSDGMRFVWVRQQTGETGEPVEVGFVSTSRAEQESRYSELIEYKFVSLPGSSRARFEQGAQGRTSVSSASSTGVDPTGREREEDHKASVHGIRPGMNAQQVFELVGGRAPDTRRDLPDEVVVSWRLSAGDTAGSSSADTVEVHFRGERVWQVALGYADWRPTTDLWLLPLSQPPSQGTIDQATTPAETPAGATAGPPAPAAVGGALAPSPYGKIAPSQLSSWDPRWRRDYKVLENIDKTRVSWTRLEKFEEGYEVEVRFVSVAKQRLGERFVEYVEYKIVGVPKDELRNFDSAYKGR